MTNSEIERIAKGLTKAQKRALLWCNADGTPRIHQKGPQTSFYCLRELIKGNPEREMATICMLVRSGTSPSEKRGEWPFTTWRCTPLGLRVRAYLKEQDNA